MPLRLKNWQLHFEVAKSRAVDLKSWGSYPLKSGLGLLRLLSTKSEGNPFYGAALYGAFMGLLTVLHRQRYPQRDGWLTEDGKPGGREHTAETLSALTRMPAELFEALLQRLREPEIDWLADFTKDGAEREPPSQRPKRSDGMTPGQIRIVLEQVNTERDGLWNRYHFDRGKPAQDKAPGPWQRFQDLTARKAQLETQLADYGKD